MRRYYQAVITLLFLSLSTAAGAQEAIEAQTRRVANVRSGPGMEYTPLEQLDAGHEVRLTGRSASNAAWLRLESQGREGWIIRYSLEESLEVETDYSRLRAVNPRRPVRLPSYRVPPMIYASRTVNVRANPTTDAEVVSRLEDGDRVPALGRSDEGTSWLWVDLDGERGWVAYFTVAVDEDVVELPLVSSSSTPADDTKQTPRSDTGVTAHVFRTVNVRSGPAMTYDRLGQLESGDVVVVTGRSDTENNWLQIDFEGNPGWVAYFTVSPSGNLQALPVIEMEAESSG